MVKYTKSKSNGFAQRNFRNTGKFVVISMKETDYFDYQLIAYAYKYSTVPFTKVKQSTYQKHEKQLDFSKIFLEKSIDLKPRSTVDVKNVFKTKLEPCIIEGSSQVDCMNSQTSDTNKLQRKQKLTLPKRVVPKFRKFIQSQHVSCFYKQSAKSKSLDRMKLF